MELKAVADQPRLDQPDGLRLRRRLERRRLVPRPARQPRRPPRRPRARRRVVGPPLPGHKAGIAPEKLVVGVPFYGRGWVVADARDDGLFQRPAKDPPRGFAPGFEVAYRSIPAKLPGASRQWDAKARSPYLFDPARKVFFGYDDAESLRLKADYVRDHRLGGLMIWELSQDDPKGTLIQALAPRRP